MAITLSEAKAFLAPYVDNGIYPGDDRVIARINEAQRRLHSYRAWLGVMAKFSVNVVGNTFDLPAPTGNLSTFAGFGLESATRIAETSAPVGFMTNDVQAFIGDSGSLVMVRFAAAIGNFKTFELIGDSVNVASRLESQTKKLGWPIIVAIPPMVSSTPAGTPDEAQNAPFQSSER